MRRFLILLRTELLAWRHDPIGALGGFVPTVFLLLALGLLFGGPLSFNIAVVNHDAGPYGAVLRQTCAEVLSPFGTPYYAVSALDEDARGRRTVATASMGCGSFLKTSPRWPRARPRDRHALQQLQRRPREEPPHLLGRDPGASTRRSGWPAAPLALAERYPLPEMLDWFPIMAVGVALLSFMLGSMTNMFMLTQKEQVARITLEFGLAPRPSFGCCCRRRCSASSWACSPGPCWPGDPGVVAGRVAGAIPARGVGVGRSGDPVLGAPGAAGRAALRPLLCRHDCADPGRADGVLRCGRAGAGARIGRPCRGSRSWSPTRMPSIPCATWCCSTPGPRIGAKAARTLLILAGFAAFGLMVGWGRTARGSSAAGISAGGISSSSPCPRRCRVQPALALRVAGIDERLDGLALGHGEAAACTSGRAASSSNVLTSAASGWPRASGSRG